MAVSTPPWLGNVPALDPAKLALRTEEAAFLKQQTGIEDDERLQEHIISVQQKAYVVCPYPCIRSFAFTSLKISKLPPYQHVLQLGRERPNALFVDVGCCLGNDVRKLVADGSPMSQMIATDYYHEFWRLGNELFNTADAEGGVRFIPGDIFHDAHLNPEAPVQPTLASLAQLECLTPLVGHVSAIHASSLFHLFSENQQAALVRRLSALIKPEPGSVIFGSHIAGGESPGIIEWRRKDYTAMLYCHNSESWRALWVTVCGERGLRVEVRTAMLETASDFQIAAENTRFMEWEVLVI